MSEKAAQPDLMSAIANDPGPRHDRLENGAKRSVSVPLTLSLRQTVNGQRSMVGGKVANLAVLTAAKLPVPPGICVTVAAFWQFLDSAPRRSDLERLLTQVTTDQVTRVQKISQQATDCLVTVPVPPTVREAVLAAWRELGKDRVYAVRSSATVEDADDHSFAGQFESVLNVKGSEALLTAVKHCWLSLYSARALAYHARERLPVEKAAMAVLIQEMIPAEIAGVLFTTDPVSGDASRMVIEAAKGVGDRLVSGKATPDLAVLDKASLQIIQCRAGSESACLNDRLARRLAKLACTAEALFSRPLDIEWAAAGNEVFLLQARPATALAKPKTWEDRQRWSNVNTGEIFPDVATPMTWSVIQFLMKPLFRSMFRLAGADSRRAPAAGLVAGRIYFNANTGFALLKPFGFLVGSMAQVAQAVGGGQAAEYARGFWEIPAADLPDVGFRWPKYLLSFPRILYDLFRHRPRRGDGWILEFKARGDEFRCLDIAYITTPELVGALRRLLGEAFQGWDLLYLVTQAAALPVLQKACRDWLNDPDLTLGYRLFAGLGGVPEAEAGLALWRLATLAHEDSQTSAILRSEANWRQVRAQLTRTPAGCRFVAAWTVFMLEHGHHCRGELELNNARWCETPDYILGLVRGYLRSLGQSNPIEHHRRIAEARHTLTKECRRQLGPVKRWLFSWALKRSQRLAVNREVWKNEAVQHVHCLRRILLTLGQNLHREGVFSNPVDIFFLEISEVEPVATSKASFDYRELIRARREDYQRNLTLFPPSFVVGKYDPATPTMPTIKPAPGSILLEGIPVSPGIIEGPARVILHCDDQEQVQPGEILIAPFTDPAWTPYFIPAAGVIIDQGGVLSHGSIIARELGLPAVTNTISATTLIRTGDIVHLDGNRGRVTILIRANLD